MKTHINIILCILILPFLLNLSTVNAQDIIVVAGRYNSPYFLQSNSIDEDAIVSSKQSGLIVTEKREPAVDYRSSHVDMIVVDSDFRIFPNPVHNILYFEINTDKEMILRASIFDARGRRVLEIQDFSVISEYRGYIDISKLTIGRLFLRFMDRDGNLVKTFIVLKRG
jgi:hypothetical protein